MRQGKASFKFFLMNFFEDFFVSSGQFAQRRRGLPEAACKVCSGAAMAVRIHTAVPHGQVPGNKGACSF